MTKTPLGMILYRAVATLADPFISLWFALRLRKGKEDKSRFGERLGFSNKRRPRGPLVWLHGASVGETISILPLIQKFREERPDLNVLVTSGTVTSARLMKERLPDGVIHQFAPIDHWFAVRRFMERWRPDVSVFVESELWPEMLYQSPRPMLIGGRMSARSAKRFRKFRWFWLPLLRRLRPCLAQTDDYARRFKAAGAGHVSVGGNLKDDAPELPVDQKRLTTWKKHLAGRKVLLAASTHEGEDDAILTAHEELKRKSEDLLTIIVPRHPDRGAAIAEAASKMAPTQRYSENQELDKDTRILVADTIGDMGLWYRLATVAVVGGSFIPHGGQNPLEAVRLGCPVVCGPYMFNFDETVKHLNQYKLLTQVSDVPQLLNSLALFFEVKNHRAQAIKNAAQAMDELGDITQVAMDAIIDRMEGVA